MDNSDNKRVAQNMMSVYGLRAQAVVYERIAEARACGATEDFDKWQAIRAAISDLRRSNPAQQMNGENTRYP